MTETIYIGLKLLCCKNKIWGEGMLIFSKRIRVKGFEFLTLFEILIFKMAGWSIRRETS